MGNYTLAISRDDYDSELTKYQNMFPTRKLRDEEVNLCDIGHTSSDLSRILGAFEHETIDQDFIEKMTRILTACGTAEQYELDATLSWLKKNIGKNFILVYE